MGTLFLAAGVVLNTISNLLFKAGAAIEPVTTRKGLLIGCGLFVGFLGTLGYIKSLEKTDLATAFPVFSAATIVLVVVMSFLVFDEPVSLQKGAGVALLCGGIFLIWMG